MLTPCAVFSGKKIFHDRDGRLPALAPPRFTDTPTVAATCPRCQRNLAAYRFATGDGLSIVTYHCTEHGDVIPHSGALARDHQ